MGAAEEFAERFVHDIPGFEELYSIHLEDHGKVLPHVFFSIDVIGAVLDSYLGRSDDGPDWRLVFSYLEGKFKLHITDVDRVIVTPFLDQLPYEGQPGADIARSLGPGMKAKLAELRPSSL